MLVVLIALMAALWPRSEAEIGTQTLPGATEEPEDTSQLGVLRAGASLPPCPAPNGTSAGSALTGGPLAELTLECLADGSPVDLGAALAGKPVVLNLWAYWCGPCREELPAMEQFAERAGDAVTVLTVHKDKSQAKGLAMLEELRVRLPGVADPGAKIAAAVSAPNVLPVTVLLRADGTVAAVLAVPFTDADQIAGAVREHLGVVA